MTAPDDDAASRDRAKAWRVLLPVVALLLVPFTALVVTGRLGTVADAVLSPFTWRAHAAARPTPNAGLILGWREARGAKSYVVRFLGEGGRELDRIDGIETLEVVLTRDALPRNLKPGSTVRWSVVALAEDGRERGHSAPQALRLP